MSRISKSGHAVYRNIERKGKGELKARKREEEAREWSGKGGLIAEAEGG